jgi:hypothetical protein
MAKRRPFRPGIEQRVLSTRTTWTKQHLKTGATVYRKNGKFVSRQAYQSARSRNRRIDPTRIETSALGRAQDKGDARRPRTQWVLEDGETDFGRAGPFANTLFPELQTGDLLSAEQRRALYQDMRLLHGFETFWHFRFPELSRAEAERRFMAMIDRLRKLRTGIERDDVREEFGIDRYETMSG